MKTLKKTNKCCSPHEKIRTTGMVLLKRLSENLKERKKKEKEKKRKVGCGGVGETSWNDSCVVLHSFFSYKNE